MRKLWCLRGDNDPASGTPRRQRRSERALAAQLAIRECPPGEAGGLLSARWRAAVELGYGELAGELLTALIEHGPVGAVPRVVEALRAAGDDHEQTAYRAELLRALARAARNRSD